MVEKGRDELPAKIKRQIDIPNGVAGGSPVVPSLPSPVTQDGRAFVLGQEMKRPSFQFYPDAWLSDIALRAVSSASRGLWIDMMALMHQGEPYGHLRLKDANGGCFIPNEQRLSKMTGNLPQEVGKWLAELEECGVLGRTKKGVIFSRRMVRDEKQRAEWKREKASQRKKAKELPGSDVRSSVRSMSGRSSSSSSSSSSPSNIKKEKRKKSPQFQITWSEKENLWVGKDLEKLKTHIKDKYVDEFSYNWVYAIWNEIIDKHDINDHILAWKDPGAGILGWFARAAKWKREKE